MDSIYSRKRIKIPKINKLHKNNKNAKKFFSIFIIIIIAIFTFYCLINSIGPIFEGVAIEKARNVGTSIMNNASNKILNKTEYKDIVKIEKNDDEKILKTDVTVINKIASDIALEIESEFSNLEKETIKIPIGALTGIRFLSGSGPNFNIKVVPTGNVLTEVKSEFESKGINQTTYRIYLEINCKVRIVTQYKEIEDEIINQVLLVETVIVGNVPETYYNLQGINQNDAIDIIE